MDEAMSNHLVYIVKQYLPEVDGHIYLTRFCDYMKTELEQQLSDYLGCSVLDIDDVLANSNMSIVAVNLVETVAESSEPCKVRQA